MNFSGKNIIIVTYLTESGLWYLAKTLGDLLSKNNNVIYVPKTKYRPTFPGSNQFERFYPVSNDKGLLKDVNCIKFSEDLYFYDQMVNAVKDNDIDIVISFETLMRKTEWIKRVKANTGAKVIDVPMSEWVSKSSLSKREYDLFDEIWCLTDTSYNIFSDFRNRKKMSWDYVDRRVFFSTMAKKDINKLTFYHPGSVNPGASSKNTAKVLAAFKRFSDLKNADAKLIVTGRLTDEEERIAKSCNNIEYIKGIQTRKDIVKLYNRSHCVICPSTREGLGLSFYEAKAMECGIITTDIDPMNIHTEYLCKVTSYNDSDTCVQFAITSINNIFGQIIKFSEDYKMSENEAKEIVIKKKAKSEQKISEENSALMEAFGEGSAEENVDEVKEDVLNKLRQKMNQKQEEHMPEVVDTRAVSIEMAVIGVGQAGSRIAEVFHTSGYDVGVINTSAQDLEFIGVSPNQKLLLEGSLGGTGKDLDLGREIFLENVGEISSFVDNIVDGNHMVYLAVSGGGGTGSSSVDTMVQMLFNTGMPVGVIYVLPKATEDAKSKRNSIETLSRLAKMTAENMVSSLVVVDNARIEQIYANLSQSKFWETANSAIVEPLHVFNSLTSTPSRFTSLDPSDFGKIISCGDCSVYGVMEVEDYMEETALAEAVIESLSSNMLAEGFDISQTRVGGVIISGSKKVLDNLPAININYCFHMISEQTNGASVFQGVYDVDSDSDSVKIYTWFAGLGLPKDRIENLKQESVNQAAIASQKEKNRASAMTLDLEDDKINNVANEVHRKIQKKKSGFNRLQRGARSSIIDRRRKK